MIDAKEKELAACPRFEIAAYVDGELDAECEAILEEHIAGCRSCAAELNIQKSLLRAIGLELASSDPELPADFAKQIIIKAESSVEGLRHPGERFNTIFIVAAFGLFILFAAGAEMGGVVPLLEKAMTVAGVAGHFFVSFFIGVSVVLRNAAYPLRSDAAVLIVPVLMSLLSVALVSRVVGRYRRLDR